MTLASASYVNIPMVVFIFGGEHEVMRSKRLDEPFLFPPFGEAAVRERYAFTAAEREAKRKAASGRG